jgi:hypothetical protein
VFVGQEKQMTWHRRDFLRVGLSAGAGFFVRQRLAGTSSGMVVFAGADEDASLRDRVGNQAEKIIQNARHTKYQHNAYIDEATGTYDVDCSDYVSYVLERVSKRRLDMIPKEDWWPVPRAYKYYEYFHGLSLKDSGGWRQIEQLAHVRRGDIIAWQLPGSIEKDRDTGHVFVVADTPSALEGPLLSVRACDSSVLRHYDDSRVQDGIFHDGVGSGAIHFRVDAAGRPIAFQFGPGDHFHEDPIAIGRIEPIS